MKEKNRFKKQSEIVKLKQLPNSTSDIKFFLSEVVKIVHKCLHTDYVNILQLTEDKTKLKIIEGVGWKKGTIGNVIFDVDSFQEGYTLINNRPVIVKNFNDESRFNASKLLLDHKVVSSITVIIPGNTGPFGILGVYSTQPRKFKNEDINFLSSIIYILSSLIQNIEKIQSLERGSKSLLHDLNNYLNIINGHSEKLTSDVIELNLEEALHNIRQIKKITSRSLSLSTEFLRSNEALNEKSKVINVNDLIIELNESIIILLGNKISLVYDLDSDLFYVNINIIKFQQSILNLIINSKDAIVGQGTIVIKTFNYILTNIYKNFDFNALPGDYAAISIIDNGTGMTKDTKANLFEPFFTTKNNKGTGLGLSSIYKFVSESNGFITVSSDEETGTILTMFLKRSNNNIEK